MNAGDLTITVRVLVDGAGVPLWRLRLLRWCARVLSVPLRVEEA